MPFYLDCFKVPLFITSMIMSLYPFCKCTRWWRDFDDVFCHGPLLDFIQQSGIYEDSKTFVDMHMLMSPESVLRDFEEFLKQEQLSREVIQKFVQEHFGGPGDELEAWIPGDWSGNPKLLQRLKHPSLKEFARSLNDLWKSLGRKILPMDHPERYTLLHVPHPFIIPGDRFREFYYWDTYWIIGGLLVVDMIQTARGMLCNLLQLVDKYGFVPNGGRIYYTNRSQPPLLIPMVNLYFEKTGEIGFLQQNISVMEKEYHFWIQNRTIAVKGSNGTEHHVAIYKVHTSEPRPEGYMADVNAVKDMSGEARFSMLSHIASACESGWDFSSRWFGVGTSNRTVMACHIVPVDLNVFLCWNEQLLAKFHGILGNKEKQKLFHKKATARKLAIDDLFWNDNLGAWFDINFDSRKANTEFYPSNVFPLFADCTNLHIGEPLVAQKVLNYIKRCGVLDFPGGIPTSMLNSGEQWDFPNAWSPVVHLFLESIARLPLAEAQQLVNVSVSKWITSNISAFKNHGYVYEKYDATTFGSPGGGGEYEVQTGFGWSIGVDLMLLDKYAGKIEPLLKMDL